MAIGTYSELQTAAANWLDRTDLTSRIPEFVALAEARFNRKLRAPDMITKDAAFSVDGQYVALPTGFLDAVRFTLTTSPVTLLEYVTPEQMAEWRETRTSSGKPRYYSVVGGNFEFLPTPDSTYTATLVYHKAIDGLATTDPNWLLTSHPDIYLYGTLLAAEPYLKNDERVVVWKAMLDEALMELRIVNDRKRVGSTPRMRAAVLG